MDGVGGQRYVLAVLPPGKKLLPIVLETGWAPGPVCVKRPALYDLLLLALKCKVILVFI